MIEHATWPLQGDATAGGERCRCPARGWWMAWVISPMILMEYPLWIMDYCI